MATLRCTSCALAFETMEAQREHYRTELHRYNLKRRTNDLGPVTEGEFLRRKAAAQALAGGRGDAGNGEAAFHAKCPVCKRSFASRATLEQHMQSKKHLQAAQQETTTPTAQLAKIALGTADAGEMKEEEAGPPAVDLRPEVCIFCDAMCGDVEACVLHMWRRHGFHLPDAEYLVDLRGLLRYVAEKVKIGCLCLYCNGKGRKGAFATARDAQRHMADKGHAKLLYEEGEDLHEFRPFYDFSASYPVVARQSQRQGKAQRVVVEEEEEEEEEEGGGEEASLETVDSEYEEVSEDEDKEAGMVVDGGDDDDAEELLRADAAHVSALGELVLPGGRTLGHREFARYYRQRYRPEETRLAVLASREEAAGRLGVGGSGAGVVTVPGGGGVGSRAVVAAAGEGQGGDRGARRMVLKVTRAAQRAQMRIKLRTEINANKFHSRPDQGV